MSNDKRRKKATPGTPANPVGDRGENDQRGKLPKYSPFQRASELFANKVGGYPPGGKRLRGTDVPEADQSIWSIVTEYELFTRPQERALERLEIRQFNKKHPFAFDEVKDKVLYEEEEFV